jgi:hypothetical protein
VKVADAFPAAMVTEAGTVAWVLLLFSLTVMPPAGAGPVRVTVPVEATPPARVDGLNETD